MTTRRGGASPVGKIAGLTIVNAMVFQEVLADYETQVQHLRQTLQVPDVVTGFADHWEYIVTQINYHPIFHAAHQLLLALPSNPDTERAMRSLAQTALDIVRQRAAMRHDLMGRVYHKLLAEAKYLGTYYTSVPAATLLLKLALDPQKWEIDWQDVGELSLLKIGDLACGTGTLLMAAAETVTDNYLRACGEQRKRPNLEVLSRLLMEEILYGYDVLLSALHLTASTLALRSPEVTFRQMHLWNLPHGGRDNRLGSIEFLKDSHVPIITDLFGASTTSGQVTGSGTAQRVASLPDLDLCVMNPPFTRSVGGNLLFGSLPSAERKGMQQELARLVRRPLPHVYANSTAGLASVFVALGDFHLKKGGRLALVLPKALLSGVAWKETRRLMSLRYHLEYLIVNHDPERWNFSDNTDLSEVLVVAKKREDGENTEDRDQQVTCVNLWKNPPTPVEALNIAHTLTRSHAPDLTTSQGALDIMIGNTKVGEASAVSWHSIKESSWMPPCAYAQFDLTRISHFLLQGDLKLPGRPDSWHVPLCSLNDLGSLGPDRRDVYDGFNIVDTPTAYPAFWGHDAPSVRSMSQNPNKYLSPLPTARPDRHLRRATDLWPKAGRVVIGERLWLKTQSLVATKINQRVLSNVWWPFSFHQDAQIDEKCLVIWLNSTLGLLIMWSLREETRGAWIDFKKPVLAAMPVLDIRALSGQQKIAVSDAYDRLCREELLPFPQMAQDPVRAQMDDAISQALGLPDLRPLRELLAREPVVCLKPLY